jgi:CRISPR-associated endonuclease/helicase Cas3
MASEAFATRFEALTGNVPFPWQIELYAKWFAKGRFPPSCNLPTGVGKTSVIAIWLIALLDQRDKVPTRLVYVVNRRTVVDQTTDEVEKLRDNIEAAGLLEGLRQRCSIPLRKGESPLALSTLRGQFADNREWSADPSRPAVICGTVDMIGSRLLFSGYRSGLKTKPLHAGFLGQDALLVHDEAHLEPAFQELLNSIKNEQRRCEEFRALHVIALSATSRKNGPGGENGTSFELTDAEKSPPAVIPDPPTEPVHHVWRRIRAKKGLKFHPAKRDDIAKIIGKIARNRKASEDAVLVFVRRIDDVSTVQQVLTDKKEGVRTDQIQVLTGTQRGRERDLMATEDPVFARFLPKPKVTKVTLSSAQSTLCVRPPVKSVWIFRQITSFVISPRLTA